MNNNKWVRQWIAIAMSVYVIVLGWMQGLSFMAEMPVMDLPMYLELTAPAYGFIGWFFRARDIEKKQEAQGE